jgi:CubicO group peptidase (beta-lactamase class C family)
MTENSNSARICTRSGEAGKPTRQWDWNRLDALIETLMQHWNVPGLALALVEHDVTLLAKGYGVRDIHQSTLVDANTLFAIASCTKAFTATALALLHDEGKLQWFEPLRTHLPTFQFHDPYTTQQATLFDVLTHRTGAPFATDIWYGTSLSRAEVLEEMRNRVGVPLRSQFDYNNIMYLAAGQVIPAITGTSFDDFLRTRIFHPLGMGHTNTSTHQLTETPNVASPHARVEGRLDVAPWRNVDNVAPAAAINSTASDMARWLQFQVQRGRYGDTQVVSATQVEMMLTPQTLVNPRGWWASFFPDTPFLSYGLGWFVYDHQGYAVAAHPGVIDGMRAVSAVVPKEGFGAVILTNRGWENGSSEANMLPEVLLNTILDDYLSVARRDWHHVFKTTIQSA